MPKEFAKRFPSDTPLEVYGPGNPQDVIINQNSTTYFTFDGSTVSLYVNGVIRQSWTTAPIGTSGTPLGILLSITQE